MGLTQKHREQSVEENGQSVYCRQCWGVVSSRSLEVRLSDMRVACNKVGGIRSPFERSQHYSLRGRGCEPAM